MRIGPRAIGAIAPPGATMSSRVLRQQQQPGIQSPYKQVAHICAMFPAGTGPLSTDLTSTM